MVELPPGPRLCLPTFKVSVLLRAVEAQSLPVTLHALPLPPAPQLLLGRPSWRRPGGGVLARAAGSRLLEVQGGNTRLRY